MKTPSWWQCKPVSIARTRRKNYVTRLSAIVIVTSGTPESFGIESRNNCVGESTVQKTKTHIFKPQRCFDCDIHCPFIYSEIKTIRFSETWYRILSPKHKNIKVDKGVQKRTVILRIRRPVRIPKPRESHVRLPPTSVLISMRKPSDQLCHQLDSLTCVN